MNKNNLSITNFLEMSQNLWKKNKDSWEPMTPEYGKISILYMIEEIGEIIALLKKKDSENLMTDSELRERFIEELADVLMYYSDVLNRFNITAKEFSNIYYKKYHYNLNRDYIKDHDES